MLVLSYQLFKTASKVPERLGIGSIGRVLAWHS